MFDIKRTATILRFLAKQHQVLYQKSEERCLIVDEALLCQVSTIFKICRRVSGAQKKIFKEIPHPNDPDGAEAEHCVENTDVDNSEFKTILKSKILNV